MNPILTAVAILMTLELGFVSFVQHLYLESQRLRARELPALEFFKDELEEKIGLKTELGALSFSLMKHTLLALLGVVVLAIAVGGEPLGWRAAAEGAGFSFVLMMIGAYIGPQLLYRKTGARWLLPLTPLLRLMALTVRPLTGLFCLVQTLANLGQSEDDDDENGSTPEEDLEALIEAGADEGLIEDADRQLIHSVVALGDKTVREVMTPRPNVVSIDEESTIEEFRNLAIESPFSRFPVCRGSIDEIAGIVHVRDILEIEYDKRPTHKVKEFVHRTNFVPETKPVADLFREMQKNKIHMSIVVDEYGETAGIATMEDVVEEVFGEIEDEYDPGADVREETDGVYLMSGNVDLDRLHELVEFRPDEEIESTTVGGLVSEWLGHMPEVGEVVGRDGIRIEVTDADERHVIQIRVARTKIQEPEAAGPVRE